MTEDTTEWHKEANPKQREFFNELATSWDQSTVHDPAKVRYIRDRLDLQPNDRVLDIGTGTGVMIPFYLERVTAGSILALDYAPNMITEAKRKYPPSARLQYVIMDLYDLTAKNVYDKVVCYSCFPHFPDPQQAIKILTRALRPGGTFCIAHSLSREGINQVHREGGTVICHDYLPPMEVMTQMFHRAGLTLIFSRDDDEYYLAYGRKNA